MVIYSILFLFNKFSNFCARRQNFIQLVRFLFDNFRCPIGQRTNQLTLELTIDKMVAMAATIEEVLWRQLLAAKHRNPSDFSLGEWAIDSFST